MTARDDSSRSSSFKENILKYIFRYKPSIKMFTDVLSTIERSNIAALCLYLRHSIVLVRLASNSPPAALRRFGVVVILIDGLNIDVYVSIVGFYQRQLIAEFAIDRFFGVHVASTHWVVRIESSYAATLVTHEVSRYFLVHQVRALVHEIVWKKQETIIFLNKFH